MGHVYMADDPGGTDDRQRVPPASSSRDVAAALGARLAELREARNLTQEALAHQVGISRNHLQLLEAGLSDRAKRTPANPTLDTLMRLCRALHVQAVIDLAHPSGTAIRFIPEPGHELDREV